MKFVFNYTSVTNRAESIVVRNLIISSSFDHKSFLLVKIRNLNDVVSYPVTIDGIQEIVMSYTATVYYSRDAEHFIDIFTAIYKFFCGPIGHFI